VAGFIGRRLGFEDAGAGGWDAIQGHVESIRGSSAAGRAGGHGAEALASPLPRAPHGASRGRQGRGKEIRSDRLGPHGSERRREVGVRRAGWLCWAERDRCAAA
jgi:hypothetical protein